MQITQPRWGIFGQRYGSFAGKTATEQEILGVQATAIFHTNPKADASFHLKPKTDAVFHTNPSGSAIFHE